MVLKSKKYQVDVLVMHEQEWEWAEKEAAAAKGWVSTVDGVVFSSSC